MIERAIRHAQAADLVGRNVASLIAAPEGKSGRPSRSLTLDQAVSVLRAAEESPLHAYVVLSLLAGLRTEELRSLRWTEVDLDGGAVAVYRSVRASGDTKTPKSGRVLKLPVKKAVGLGQAWTPRELRHTFVRLLSANDVTLEDIARLAGHSSTA